MRLTTLLSNAISPRRPSTSSSILLLLLVFLTLSSTTAALKQPTSYCKCICFQNSTIIPLNSPPPSSSSSPSTGAGSHARSLFNPLSLLSSRNPSADATEDDDTPSTNTSSADDNGDSGRKHHTLTCNDCNRAFCLNYNLPICKNAKESDVFATCFQRDSLKDRTIVILFLLATSSLLGWAVIKPFVVKTSEKISANTGVAAGVLRGRYTPARTGGGAGGGHVYNPSQDLDVTANGGSVLPLQGSSSGNGGERRLRTGGGSLSRQGGLNS